MANTIGIKRAKLMRAWVKAQYGNNEEYYFYTLSEGVPDGTDLPTLLEDLQAGEYDAYIDETLAVYDYAEKKYAKDGYYYKGQVYQNPEVLFDLLEIHIPNTITKCTKISDIWG